MALWYPAPSIFEAGTWMKITFVKKIKADGEPCRKCADVQERLEAGNQMRYIQSTVIADERDPQSEGMKLAQQHKVEQAPFFIVEDEGGATKIYTIYFQLVKEVLAPMENKA